jgi:signal transduction histidine kinase
MRTGSRKADFAEAQDTQEEPPEEELFVEIIDTGIGMPPDMHQRVFEPFVTTKTHGSGLGLAISQKIIKQHRGKITVQSTPGQGSTFVVILPVTHENILDLEAEA